MVRLEPNEIVKEVLVKTGTYSRARPTITSLLVYNNKRSLICINNNNLNMLISEKQFGFKYKHSAVDAIHLLTSHVNWNWNNKKCTGACLIDMEKAFDTVWI